MDENVIFVKRYFAQTESLSAINEREIWRYSGYQGIPKEDDHELKRNLSKIMEELTSAFSYQVCYRRLGISWENDMPVLRSQTDGTADDNILHSKDLAKCLKGSSEIIIFAATIGLEIDRKIKRYQKQSPSKALLMQAYGAERIEALCDCFCKEMKEELEKEGLTATPRFSPGYGDLPLNIQTDIFQLLDITHKIGISLNESLLMTPSKSVTAIFGIKER